MGKIWRNYGEVDLVSMKGQNSGKVVYHNHKISPK